MAKANRKPITTRKITQRDDAALIALGRKMTALRAQAIEATNYAIDREDDDPAHAHVQAIWAEMDRVFDRTLRLTPKTPEGYRTLAQAIAHRCAATPEICEPQSEYERGVGALLTALGADVRAA